MKSRTVIFGLILVLIGLLLLGRVFDLFWFSFGQMWSVLAPVALIILGIWLMMRKRRREREYSETPQVFPPPPAGASWGSQPEPPPAPPSPTSDMESSSAGSTYYQPPRMSASPRQDQAGRIRYSKTLGDLYIDANGLSLQNVEVLSGIGDLEIKLHGGRLVSGLNRLVISGFIGDIRIYVPPSMPHFAHCSNFIGDVDLGGRKASGFGNNIDGQSPDYERADAKLYIAVNSFIGDIRVFSL